MLTTAIYCGVLAFIWMCLMSKFTFPMFVAGYLVGLLVLLLYRRMIYGKAGYRPMRETCHWNLHKLGRSVSLGFVFAWELLKANIAVLKVAFSPKMKMAPGIVAMPVALDSNAELTLLANMITLTPGTISMDISPENDTIFVHALDCSDPQGVVDGIDKAFSARIKGVRRDEYSPHAV